MQLSNLQLGGIRADLHRGEIRDSGGRVERLTERERAVLAYLAARDGEPVSRSELLVEVWGWSPRTVTRAVDDLVKRLRPKIEPDPSAPRYLLTAHGIGYRLVNDRPLKVMPKTAPAEEQLLQVGPRVVDLRRAVIRGPAGEEPLTTGEVALLEALAATGGRPVDSDRLQRQLSGSADGRALVHAVRRLRAKIEDDPSVPRYLRTVRGQGYALILETVPAPLPRPVLRVPSSGLVGREALLSGVQASVEAGARAVRLTGPAGAGKTRLARELAADAGRTWWIDVHGITDQEGLEQAVEAAALQQGFRGRLLDVLRGAPLRLVLDGTDALQDPGPIEGWLSAVPMLSVILVGRRVPPLPGAASFEVGPLEKADARALFEDRARQARPGWAPAPAEVETLNGLLVALDCLPLGIELAAAQVSLLSLAQIRERLEAGPDALRRPGQQGRVEAVIGPSWSLLPGETRHALARACVLPDPFDLSTWEAVSGPFEAGAVGDLQALLDLHLLERVPDRSDAVARYRPYALVRAYALARLRPEEEARVLDRLATQLASQVDPTQALSTSTLEVMRWQARSIEAAIGALPDDDLRLWPLALASAGLWRHARPVAGGEVLVARLERARPPDPVVGAVTWSIVCTAFGSRAPELAARAAERAREQAARGGGARARAHAEASVALVHELQGRPVQALGAYTRALAAARDGGVRLLEARLLAAQAAILRKQGRHDEARQSYRKALELHAVLDEPDHEAICRLNRAVLLRSLGRYEAAAADLRRCAEHAMARGMHDLESCARQNLGVIHKDQGNLEAAWQELELAVRLAEGSGHRVLAAVARSCLGLVLVRRGDGEAAGRALMGALAEHRAMGNARWVALTEVALAQPDPMDGLDRADTAVAAARTMGLVEDLGTCLVMRARMREAEGEMEAAVRDLEEAASTLDEGGEPCRLAIALAALARLRPQDPRARERLARARDLAWRLGVGSESALAEEIERATARPGPGR